jgi:AraC family L-rhamnose operon regulatory protein RhaS
MNFCGSTEEPADRRGGERPAVYREAGRVYKADTCESLIDAAAKGSVRLRALGRGSYPGERLQAGDLTGLRSIGFWDAGPNQTWGLKPHRNEGLEITFLSSGHTPIMIEGHEESLAHDQLMITRPWQEHRIGNPNIGACKLGWIIIDLGVRRPHQEWRWPPWIVLCPQDLADLTCFLRQNEQYVWNGTPDMRRCFLRLIQALDNEHPDRNCSRLAVLANELLICLLEMFRSQEVTLRESLTSSERTVRMFLKELEGSLDEQWTLDSMAESCHMGITQFVSYFKKVTNLTPANFLSRARLEKARALLAVDSDRSITDIAFACGFSSSQYFAGVFHKHFGCSARDYRQQRQGRPM